MIKNVKSRIKEWKAKKIEKMYFDTFPERKAKEETATMEILHTHIYPQTFELSSTIDLRIADEDCYTEFVRKELAAKIGQKLLESDMFDERYMDDYYGMQKRIVFRLRVLPPERR